VIKFLRLSYNIIIDDESLAISVPYRPIENPTSEDLKAAASLFPSPTYPTIYPV
jgi:hypothetical protein